MVALASAERFDGWRIVTLAAFAQGLALPLLGAFGLVATPLIEEFGASTTQLGIGMSLAILATALAAPAFVGTSAAAFVMPPATAWGIEWLGWRGALVALASAAALLATPVITAARGAGAASRRHPR